MKNNKRLMSLIISFVMFLNFLLCGITRAYAHASVLDVQYDACVDSTQTLNEKWYVLVYPGIKCYHIDHEIQTIKYYFADESTSGYRWDSDISSELAEEIKTSYANSMEKWNNVYFYSYNSDGFVTKNKVINIEEGSATDHNLIIYPEYTSIENAARVSYIDDNKEIIENGSVEHSHISDWIMTVNLYYFYINSGAGYNEAQIDLLLDRTGAHEMGHILGLRDIDEAPCGNYEQTYHHQDLLMGYGSVFNYTMARDITYKDIAGVAITRGFHTDSDHKWLYAGQQSDGTYKLICSICNGVKYVESLSGYTYNTYNACGENHALSSGNMMAVASYGTTDYYKCKYCRYVAPFSSNVPQNYTVASCSNEQHKYTNNVDGLEYRFYEDHNIEYTDIGTSCHTCSCACGYTITNQAHSFRCEKESSSYHRKICDCGYTQLSIHHLVRKSVKYSICMDCGYVQYHNGEIIEVPGIESVEGEEELPL